MNPYNELMPKHFWKTAVAGRHMFDLEGIWSPKFQVERSTKVVTYGSCFAQRIGQELRKRGYDWLVTESAPQGLSSARSLEYGYDVFSARTGNIYTPGLLLQWLEWAVGNTAPPDACWENNSRFYDLFRPTIEPKGFSSPEEVYLSRKQSINSFFLSVEQADVFVFTLGLVECWRDIGLGVEYPICPGTVAGEFNPNQHDFYRYSASSIIDAMTKAVELLRKINPLIKIILTVSPVPLTATCSGKHVLVANTHSKSLLRVVAEEFSDKYDFIDYFPSYELIATAPMKSLFYNSNMRTVSSHGVNFVMSHFFAGYQLSKGPSEENLNKDVCDEELMEAFAGE